MNWQTSWHTFNQMMSTRPLEAECDECGRVFDLLDEDEASEYYYGHDCEAE